MYTFSSKVLLTLLSYRHAFHAGNPADVLKHWALLTVLNYYKLKDKPFIYIDTHAGAGGYQLTGAQAQKTAEYTQGIQIILQHIKHSPEALLPYLELIQTLNQKTLSFYPGSPWIAAQVLRANDSLELFELHPQDYTLLKQQFSSDKRIHMASEDGLTNLIRLLPPKTRRAVVLIDPSYEIKTDYQLVIQTLLKAYKRFATGTYILWYPVIHRQRVNSMLRDLKASGVTDILQIELGLSADQASFGMTGSGLFIINPPWTFKQQAQRVVPWLKQHLGSSTAYYTVQPITTET